MIDQFREITVLSLEQATVLPFLSYRLAMDGMRVIRLEHPVHGDPNRLIGENVLGEDRMNSYYLCINAGKEAITLNLADPEGAAIFHRLIGRLKVDIFMTNQLPRNYEKLSIDYETLRGIQPTIIWLGVTGFGPNRNEAAYDPILQARSGLMEMTGEPDAPPQSMGIPLPDMGCAEHAYGSIMKSLYKRAVTGEGSRIDLSMFESSVSWLTVPICQSASFQRPMTRGGNTHRFFCPVSVFKTKDGFIYFAVGNDRQWKSLVSLSPFHHMDRPAYEKNAGRIEAVDTLNREIAAVTETLSTDALIEMLRTASVPVSRIQTIPEVIADPLVDLNLLTARDPVSGTKITLAPPPCTTPFLTYAGRRLSFPPRFGQHNDTILQAAGYDSSERDRLKKKGII